MGLLLDEMQLTRDAVRYGFAVGKIRVLETRSIDCPALERLLDAPTFAEMKRLLSETPYGRFLEGAETPEAIERALDDALDTWFRFLHQAELPDAVADFFRIQYDYSNLRGALKARAMGVSMTGLLNPHGAVPVEAYSAELDALPGAFGKLAVSLEAQADEMDDRRTEVSIDDAVDAAMFTEMRRLAEESKSRFLVEYTQLRIDLANVRTLVRGSIAGLSADRLSASLVPGGAIAIESLRSLAGAPVDRVVDTLRGNSALRGLPEIDLADPTLLDVALDSLAIRTLDRGRRGPIGPEPVIAYVLARQVEVSILRVLLLGQLAGIDSEMLRARVNAMRG